MSERYGSVLIIGLGLSGQAAARYFASLPEGAADRIVAVDAASAEKLGDVAGALEDAGVEVRLGTSEVAGTFDLGVASPGISPDAPVMVAARAACAEVVSEIELAWRVSTSPWIAVTGTNGKTTTTALIAHLLRCGGIDAVPVGNFGPPAVTAAVDGGPMRVLVAEVSSFQLEYTSTFHPRVAVLLNITPDHVDWHGSLEAYAESKAKVFANLNESDTAVIDIDDPGSAAYAEPLRERGIQVVPVSHVARHVPGALVIEGELALETPGGLVRLVAVEDLLIRGAHNVSNALAASAAAHAVGIMPADIREGLRTFEPIEHRLEPAGTVAGVEYYNDSKATNPDAVFKALAAFPDRQLVVLLGGRNKGSDMRPLAEETARRAKAAVLFGEARCELEGAFRGVDVTVAGAENLSEAISVAARLAEPGDVVVLSPACASFDEFANYEQRGRAFKDAVAVMAASSSGRTP